MSSITTIEGIGPSYAEKLKAAGISTTEALLKAGEKPAGRKALIAETGISDALILKWVNHADLFRVKGIGGEYAELLEAAGVDTVVELSGRNAANLFAKIQEVNTEKKLVRKLPTQKQVEGWVAQAKELPRGIHY
jgi:predicted flap endonuclease-1-like 5' DNA nuclease